MSYICEVDSFNLFSAACPENLPFSQKAVNGDITAYFCCPSATVAAGQTLANSCESCTPDSTKNCDNFGKFEKEII